jgi:tight adherence protein B
VSFTAQHILDWAVRASVFGLVLALWLIGTLLWSRRRGRDQTQLSRRLGLAAKTTGARTLRLWRHGQSVTTQVPDARPPRGPLGALDLLLRQAGLQIGPGIVLVGLLGAAIGLTAASHVLLRNPLPGLALSAAGPVVLWAYLRHRVGQQEKLFERQLVDALELAAQSLRAGHPLSGAFRFIAEEIKPPVGALFAEICQQQELGMATEDALRSAARTSVSADLRVLVAAVIIQMRTGGNLADMMDRVAQVVRDRMRLNRRVRVLTAQTQFSKRVLLILPILLFLGLNVVNPSYMHTLYVTFAGQCLLAGAVASMLLGAWVMNRLAVLRY